MAWPALFALVGIAFWIRAAYMWHRETKLRAGGLRAMGRVVRIQESQDTEGDPLFVRVARFSALDGSSIEFADSMPTRKRDGYRVGEDVAVLYDPADVTHARIDPGGTRVAALVFLFVMGSLFMGFAWMGFHFGGPRP